MASSFPTYIHYAAATVYHCTNDDDGVRSGMLLLVVFKSSSSYFTWVYRGWGLDRQDHCSLSAGAHARLRQHRRGFKWF
jgi:hypothetical protein